VTRVRYRRAFAKHVGDPCRVRTLHLEKHRDFAVDIVFNATNRYLIVVNERVGSARIAVVGKAHAARIRDNDRGQSPDVGALDVPINDAPRSESAAGVRQFLISRIDGRRAPEIVRAGVNDREVRAWTPHSLRGSIRGRRRYDINVYTSELEVRPPAAPTTGSDTEKRIVGYTLGDL